MTCSVQDFGKNCFRGRGMTLDRERRPDLHILLNWIWMQSGFFQSRELLLRHRLHLGTIYFFSDEIRSRLRTIMVLRSCYEDIPELYVVATGSLLEFTAGKFYYSVGPVGEKWYGRSRFYCGIRRAR